MEVQLKELTINIIFLGTPGILCYFILNRLIGEIGKNQIEKILLMFLFSILSYILLDLTNNSKGLIYSDVQYSSIFEKIISRRNEISPKDILWATLSGICLAYLISYGYRFNVVNRIGQKIRATNRYGDEDVWHFFQNAPDSQKNNGWVMIRDHKCNLVYYGYISTFSDTEKDREMIISDVNVFTNDDGIELYKLNNVYLCRNKYDLTIEVPRNDNQ